jgi:hypothetical protein
LTPRPTTQTLSMATLSRPANTLVETSPTANLTTAAGAPAPRPFPEPGAGKIVADGITFDDVLILPRRSGVMPTDADT